MVKRKVLRVESILPHTPMVYCPLKFTHHRDDSSAKNRIYTCEIRRISRCLLQACGTGMIVRAAFQTVVLFDVCTARAAAQLPWF